jgi:hypothetical protein
VRKFDHAANRAIQQPALISLWPGGFQYSVPVADERALARVRELGHPAGVVQLLDRHARDCRSVAERLGVPLKGVKTTFTQAAAL